MKIKEIINQHRRDFRAIYECQHCHATTEGYGYDDDYFHGKVIPAMKCKECLKTSEDAIYVPLTPKYPAGFVV